MSVSSIKKNQPVRQVEDFPGSAGHLSLAERIDIVEKSLGIFLTIHDVRGVLSLKTRDYLLPGRRWHRCPYCWEGRFNYVSWGKKCTRDCMEVPHAAIRGKAGASWKRCWKGVWELMVPIYRDEQVMLILFAGAFRDDSPELPEEVVHLPLFHREYYSSLRPKSSVDSIELSVLLDFFGNALLDELEKETENPDEASSRAELIRRFIVKNAQKDITLSDLARYLHLSLSRTGHAVSQELHMTFAAAVREERLYRALNFLTTMPEISISNLAELVGFNNPDYFIRCFSKKFGMGPRSYQKIKQKH